MKMKLVVMVVTGLLVISFTSGCASKSVTCTPIVEYVKPKKPVIEEAKVKQCRYADQLDNVKCVITNYFEMKMERDKLKAALDEVTK